MHVNSPTKKEPQQQKIIWFNPPHSVYVKRNIGRLFLNSFLQLTFHDIITTASYSIETILRSATVLCKYAKCHPKPQHQFIERPFHS